MASHASVQGLRLPRAGPAEQRAHGPLPGPAGPGPGPQPAPPGRQRPPPSAPSLTLADLPRDPAEARAGRWPSSPACWPGPRREGPEEARGARRQRPFAPARLAADIDRALAAKGCRTAGASACPGLTVWEDSKRSYGESLAAHVLGYVGEIGDTQLDRLKDDGYHIGDWLGQAGIESRYDAALKGKDGGRQVRINASGRELGVLSEARPRPATTWS